MRYDPEKHHRRSIRLKEYDYSQPGEYFITVVTENCECVLGEIENGQIKLSTFGEIIEYQWNRITKHFPSIQLDSFRIMPNHIHGIIIITHRDECRGEAFLPNSNHKQKDFSWNASPLQNRPCGTKPNSLSAIMQNFESVGTRKINRINNTPGKKFWQRNYYEHIIRNENELNRIREYIINNPVRWELDEENPKNRIKI